VLHSGEQVILDNRSFRLSGVQALAKQHLRILDCVRRVSVSFSISKGELFSLYVTPPANN